MESNAQAYSTLNKPQYDMGCEFIRSLSFSAGDKVLDMGCGTGELSKYIADIVGLDGEVVGVDPDEARVKLAQEKFKDVPNIKFLVGSSIIGFPHDNEQYYDVHFSSNTFHWIIGEEKNLYLKKAYQCLKPGGRLAILTVMKVDIKEEPSKLPLEMLTKEEYTQLFENVGLFPEFIITENVLHIAKFASFDEFLSWGKASSHISLETLDPALVKRLLESAAETQDDGTYTFKLEAMWITANK